MEKNHSKKTMDAKGKSNMDNEAGKGSAPRPVNYKKFGDNMDRIFGKREPIYYQKGRAVHNYPKDAITINLPGNEKLLNFIGEHDFFMTGYDDL